ncbi:MAG: ATP-binding protein [Halobacteriales archaeon]|nr:ATP-binding protein [Halobacteriales archaeon]
MFVDWWPPARPTKRELGAGYLAGAGLALIISLFGYIWFTQESVLVVFIGTSTALALLGTLIYISYLSIEVDFADQFVWNIAQWAALGLGLAAVFCFVVAFGSAYLPPESLVPSLLVITIATGAVIGALLGVVTGLREQHKQMREITQRNHVMNRVLRHNIRNSMNVIHGRASLLAEELDEEQAHSLETIKRTADEVVSLSEAARKIDMLTSGTGRGPVEITTIIEECLTTVRQTYPTATFESDLPETVWVNTDPIVRSVLINLLENAVEHDDTDTDTRVSITVDVDGDDILIEVADNGPGIPPDQREVLFTDREEPTRHGDGLGLWLVKWVADYYDGELRFDENVPHGSIVTLRLPAGQPPTEPDSAVVEKPQASPS